MWFIFPVSLFYYFFFLRVGRFLVFWFICFFFPLVFCLLVFCLCVCFVLFTFPVFFFFSGGCFLLSGLSVFPSVLRICPCLYFSVPLFSCFLVLSSVSRFLVYVGVSFFLVCQFPRVLFIICFILPCFFFLCTLFIYSFGSCLSDSVHCLYLHAPHFPVSCFLYLIPLYVPWM